VDWWGLGVCLYELLVGVPPFSDQTPEAVFRNILALDLEFPDGPEEALSAEAESAIRALLVRDPEARPAGLVEVQQLEFFAGVDWAGILEEEAPFLPQPSDETDTGYFDARNNLLDLKVSQIDF
jgi:serine/threonine protein kinase